MRERPKRRRKNRRIFSFENIAYTIGIVAADLISEKSRIKGFITYVKKKISGRNGSIKRVTSKNNGLSKKVLECSKYSIKDS